MKNSQWIHRYRNEQNQIHMPDICRTRILEHISSENVSSSIEQAAVYPVVPQRRSRVMAAIVAAVLLACAGTLFAIHTAEPGSNIVPEVQDIQIPPVSTEITESPATLVWLTKDQLYYRCLNTLEYLDQLSGSVTIFTGCNSPDIMQGSFAFDFTKDIYHAIVEHLDVADKTNCTQTNEYYSNSGDVVELTNYHGSQQNTYTIDHNGFSMEDVSFAGLCPENPEVNPDSPITSIQDLTQEQLYATMGQDPTNAHELAACFMPQEMTIGYLENFNNWEIFGTSEVQGRTYAMIQGTAEPDYGSRFGVETFSIVVDQETGIWMHFEGYDADGKVQSYLYTENIQFGNNANQVPVFSEKETSGYAFAGTVSRSSASEMQILEEEARAKEREAAENAQEQENKEKITQELEKEKQANQKLEKQRQSTET